MLPAVEPAQVRGLSHLGWPKEGPYSPSERGDSGLGAGGDISANSLGAVAGMESQMNGEKNKQLMPYVSFWFFEKDKILKENKDRSTSITLLHILRLHISLHPAPQAASPPI